MSFPTSRLTTDLRPTGGTSQAKSASLSISVLVPTYRRPEDLCRCLYALSKQTRPAEQIVIVVRLEDAHSTELVNQWVRQLPLIVKVVSESGQVKALNAGLLVTTGEIIAITDDDAAPRPDWLARIERHFLSDPKLGGVGGRDWVHNDEAKREQRIVGRIQWFGRIVGNHHLGVGEARRVHHLKGANMSYRASVLTEIGFDTNLRGVGAQAQNDMALSFAVRRSGWRLIYDPAVVVDHYPSTRHDNDQREKFDPSACTDAAFNKYWTVCKSMPHGARRLFAIVWCVVVGTDSQPGVLRALLALGRMDDPAMRRWKCARSGRRAARLEMNRPRAGSSS